VIYLSVSYQKAHMQCFFLNFGIFEGVLVETKCSGSNIPVAVIRFDSRRRCLRRATYSKVSIVSSPQSCKHRVMKERIVQKGRLFKYTYPFWPAISFSRRKAHIQGCAACFLFSPKNFCRDQALEIEHATAIWIFCYKG
jgi:hypothetical protein